METQNEMKRMVVLGAGESGTGAAILAKEKGYQVFVSDRGQIKAPYKAMLDQHGIEWEEGQHTMERILAADEVVKSPGIPEKAPVIQELIARQIPIISEIEFASRYTHAKMICITGSNGKTTTTSLVFDILKRAGLNVALAGNIGRSLALQVAYEQHDYYVIELSSFQLDNMYQFKADVAILLNITPDHLDRYNYEFQNYVNAKFRITQNQTVNDAFIYWAGDPVIADQLKKLHPKATLYPFGDENDGHNIAYIESQQLTFGGISDYTPWKSRFVGTIIPLLFIGAGLAGAGIIINKFVKAAIKPNVLAMIALGMAIFGIVLACIAVLVDAHVSKTPTSTIRSIYNTMVD